MVFVSNIIGPCPEELAERKAPNFELVGARFPDEEVISRTAKLIGDYLERTRENYRGRIAYARGSFLKSIRMASEKTGVEVISVLGEDDTN